MPSLQGDDSGAGYGVKGSSATGRGVIGKSDTGIGVEGFSKRDAGVRGKSEELGVDGKCLVEGVGVRGEAKSGVGVSGYCPTGSGVVGNSDDGTGCVGTSTGGIGVWGSSQAAAGVFGVSDHDNGVLGRAFAPNASGVLGSHEKSGTGATGLSKGGFGVIGKSEGEVRADNLVAGVAGFCDRHGWGVLGQSAKGRAGVAGLSESGDGVAGVTKADNVAGVRGTNSANGDGVCGEGNIGVHGIATTNNMLGCGVYGEATVDNARGVAGHAAKGPGVAGSSGGGSSSFSFSNAGVYGVSDIAPGVFGMGLGTQPGIMGMGKTGLMSMGTIAAIGSQAGTFIGNVTVLGTLTALAKSFLIDHPLDPENATLAHASVESSEYKNVYDGRVTLDHDGSALVELPAWFEALNGSCRYQLTAVGKPMPNLHVADEVAKNQFKIAGGICGGVVCWQITGVRQDHHARHNPLVVEVPKSEADRGHYLSPESFGLECKDGIAYRQLPAIPAPKPTQREQAR